MTSQAQPSSNPPQAKITRHLYISGRVQGVSFRYFMRDEARVLGVGGWCRNLPDGRVEAWIQGSPKEVDVLTDWAHHGPDTAVVDHVEVSEEQSAEGLPVEFEIRR